MSRCPVRTGGAFFMLWVIEAVVFMLLRLLFCVGGKNIIPMNNGHEAAEVAGIFGYSGFCH